MTASFADHEIWHVLLGGDDMKRMNVDQLDDAFRLSLVDASTLVWKAGMNTWQRLGAVAGLDEEPIQLVTRRAPPPPPAPLAAPRPWGAAAPAFHTAVTPVFPAPTLVAPVFNPALRAPDPYALPRRRAAIPSEVDFRRSSRGVRLGRWSVVLLLLTAGLLAAYRQNLLREGARRLGLENKYVHAERRATRYVSEHVPPLVRSGLTSLALLPGPNAEPELSAALPPRSEAPAPVAAAAVVATPQPAGAPSAGSEPELKTVSLDSLPLLDAEPEAPAPRAHAAAPRQSAPAPRERAADLKPAKAAPPVAAKPKPAKAAPPPANDSPLKAAIRMAIAADAAK